MSTTRSSVIFMTRVAGYGITVDRHGKTFTVTYGLQKSYCDTREEVQRELASCIFHALECEGKLD
jgi:hypothetical protein